MDATDAELEAALAAGYQPGHHYLYRVLTGFFHTNNPIIRRLIVAAPPGIVSIARPNDQVCPTSEQIFVEFLHHREPGLQWSGYPGWSNITPDGLSNEERHFYQQSGAPQLVRLHRPVPV